MPVEIRYYTDPACPWSWANEPEVRRLMWEFGDEVRFTWVMGGLARQYGSEYRDTHAGVEPGADLVARQMSVWLDATADSGMPIDPRLWAGDPIASTYPACQAVKAAAEQGPDRAYAYLRRLREGLMVERRRLDHLEALAAEAAPAGLDVERFRIDLTSNAITEAFAEDLDRVRTIPDDARAAGAVSETEGRERVVFPSTLFAGENGARHAVWSRESYDAYRDAAIAAGARPAVERPAEPLEAVERFGRVATREVEVLTGRPRPVVEAELWGLAREWRLKATPVLNGTLWESL
jgi:predicted DsbA family dithiol-disulfide isomerase